MYLVDYRHILKEKYERQNKIPGLKKDYLGYAVHIGEISHGCRSCFTGEGCDYSVFIGNKCLAQCPMCYYSTLSLKDDENIIDQINNLKKLYFEKNLYPYHPVNITYNSHGEPFLYLDAYLEIYPYILQIEDNQHIKIHKRIYTSGGVKLTSDMIKTLHKLDISEVRFHPSAFNFNSSAFESMKILKKENFTITVEEPAWPKNKIILINHFPLFEEIGVSHLNIDEIDITPQNVQKIDEEYPKGRIYKNLNWHLYDEGMVYDIMEEVIKRKYSFSVLDCSSDLCRQRMFRSDHMLYNNKDWVKELYED